MHVYYSLNYPREELIRNVDGEGGEGKGIKEKNEMEVKTKRRGFKGKRG